MLGLLVATAAAFAVTEGLKLVKSPVTRTHVSKIFSPVCGCDKRSAEIRFSLRRGDTLTLDVLDDRGREVKRLVDGVFAHRGFNTFAWNGRRDSGAIAADGSYQPRIRLAVQHRTIVLPNRIVLDTQPPRVLEAKASRTTISPDGDGQSDSVRIAYRLSGPAKAILFLRGRRVVGPTRFAPMSGSLTWYGKVHGSAVPQGLYRLRLGAVDLAGNVTGPLHGKLVPVRIRYIALARHAIAGVKAGTRFGVGVDTDAAAYDWRLGSRHGVSNSTLLIVRAPAKPGRYRLVVSEHGHVDRAIVVVGPRR